MEECNKCGNLYHASEGCAKGCNMVDSQDYYWHEDPEDPEMSAAKIYAELEKEKQWLVERLAAVEEELNRTPCHSTE